jgi:hypothetical protein
MKIKDAEEAINKEIKTGGEIALYVLTSKDLPITIQYVRMKDGGFSLTVVPLEHPEKAIMHYGASLTEAWRNVLDEIETRNRAN